MKALNHDLPIEFEAGQDCGRGVVIELIGLVDVRDVFVGLRERRNNQVGVQAEYLTGRNVDVWDVIGVFGCSQGVFVTLQRRRPKSGVLGVACRNEIRVGLIYSLEPFFGFFIAPV